MLNFETHQDILKHRADIVSDLKPLVRQVITSDNELKVYETDGLSCYRTKPLAVPWLRRQMVAAVLKYYSDANIPVIARGAGTSLSEVPCQADTVVWGFSAKPGAVYDPVSKTAVVQAGVTNRAISDYVDHGLFTHQTLAAKPCTIGSNVAMSVVNRLKYGVTTNHILGVKFVTIDGEIVDIGGAAFSPSLDLLGLIVGSEVVGCGDKVTVRLMDKPEGAMPLMAGFQTLGPLVNAYRPSWRRVAHCRNRIHG